MTDSKHLEKQCQWEGVNAYCSEGCGKKGDICSGDCGLYMKYTKAHFTNENTLKKNENPVNVPGAISDSTAARENRGELQVT